MNRSFQGDDGGACVKAKGGTIGSGPIDLPRLRAELSDLRSIFSGVASEHLTHDSQSSIET
jgi:hypothetical protein